MMRRNHRLSRAAFDEVFTQDKISHSPVFIKKAKKVDSWNEYAVSVVIPKKVTRRAVMRNRIKRRIYGMIREFLPELPLPERIILILKKDPQKLSNKALRDELRHLLGL